MYEEIHNLKKEKNSLHEEIKGLKGKLSNFEKDEKSASNELTKANDQANLISSLKRSLYKKQSELQESQSELLSLKKSTNRTKIEELELEAEAFKNESKKLRLLLEEYKRVSAEEKAMGIEDNKSSTNSQKKALKKLNIIIEKLKTDNSEFGVMIRELGEENEHLHSKLAKRDKEISKLEKDKSALKKSLSEKASTIESLQQSEAAALLSLKSSMRKELQAKEDDISHLESLLSSKESTITELEVQVRSRQKELEEIQEKDLKERQVLKESLEAKKLEVESLKKQVEIHSTLVDRRASSLFLSPNQNSARKIRDSSQEEIVKEYEKKRVLRVNSFELKEIVTELRYCLMMNRIPAEMVGEVLFGLGLGVQEKVQESGGNNKRDNQKDLGKESKKRISISQLISVFKKAPFGMKNEDLVLLLARYLVENNDLDYLILNVELTEETSKVLYHFLNLVGKYDIYDENKEEVIGFEVASKVTKFYLSFKNIIANKISDARKSGGPKLEEGFISREDFSFSLEYIDMGLSPEQLEFMYMKLYQANPEMGPISVPSLFEIFGPESLFAKAMTKKPGNEVPSNLGFGKENGAQANLGQGQENSAQDKEERFMGKMKVRNEDANSSIEESEDRDYNEEEEDTEKKSDIEYGSKYNSSKYDVSKMSKVS